jgi:deoxyribodipyrimidine photo-lyase
MRDELAWRDFYADVVWHRPESARQSWLPFGHHLRWDSGRRARDLFRAWATGCTGYPLVDAGMRQLLAEGWMHNRVRMVTASFLVKDLHIDWRLGARWFMWHLVDGDLASNQHGWQWVTGTGTDAAPFHRVFNPRLQQERFDPDGTYVNRYLKGPLSSEANPVPVVDHAAERREALARYDDARQMTMTVDS